MHGGLVSGEGELRVYTPSYSIIRADAILRHPTQKYGVHSDRRHREVSDLLRACECKRVDIDTQKHTLVYNIVSRDTTSLIAHHIIASF